MPLEMYWPSMDPNKLELFKTWCEAVENGEEIPELDPLTAYDSETVEAWCVMKNLSELKKLLQSK